MSTAAVSEELHVTAWLAVLSAGSPTLPVYDIDKVPNPRPNDYVEFHLSRRFGGEIRSDGTTGTSGWRIVTRVVSRTATGARRMTNTVRSRLEYASVTVSGVATTGCLFETTDPLGSDDGYYSAATTWTYTH